MAGKPGEIIGETSCGYCGAPVYLRQTVKGAVYYRCGPGGVVTGVRMCQRRVTFGKQESDEIKAQIQGNQDGQGHPDRPADRQHVERGSENRPDAGGGTKRDDRNDRDDGGPDDGDDFLI